MGNLPSGPAPPSQVEFVDRLTPVLEGRMSLTRRFFCQLTLFQLLFSYFLWSIMLAMASNQEKTTIREEFVREIYDYTFHTSLFDVLVFDVLRCLFLLLIYGILGLSHPLPIAITTSGTTVLIIVKALLYEYFGKRYAPTLVLTFVFLLSWAQTLHFDFQVLPLEKSSAIRLAQYINSKRPALPQLSHSRSSSPYFSPAGTWSSTSEFHSPLPEECPQPNLDLWLEGSETSSLPGDDGDHEEQRALSPQEKQLVKRAEDDLTECLKILQESQWQTEKVCGLDIVQSCTSPKYGKIFKFVGVVHSSPEKLMSMLRDKDLSQWNPTLKSCQVLKKVTNKVDITHTVSCDALGGMVSSRDFVNLRCLHHRDTTYFQTFRNIDFPELAPQSYVRGVQGPSLYVLTPLEGDPSKCHFEWMVNVDLKGWLSRSIVDLTISTTMLDFMSHLREHITQHSPPTPP